MIATEALRIAHLPGEDASDTAVIRFAQSLNGYDAVGGQARDLGAYVAKLEEHSVRQLSLHDLRILLFARQRAHYHAGGGYPGEDPLMDEMRRLVELIRFRLERSSDG